MASSIPVVNVAVDWNNDGSFAGTGEDVTSRTLSRDTITISVGRDQSRAFSPTTPGQAAFSLNNISRDYSPDNTGSPLTGNVVSGRPARIQANQDATTYILYRGYTDGYTVLPSHRDRSVAVTCVDALNRFSQVTLSTALFFSQRTGAIVSAILDGIGWTGGRDLDQGASIIRYWWEEGTDALTALGKILGAEGPPALCFVDAQTGNFVFRDRHHRLRNAASVSSQATFTNGTAPENAAAGGYDTLITGASPLAWWKLADAAGTTTSADSSGNAHTGTATAVTFGTSAQAITGNTTAAFSSASSSHILTAYNPALSAVTVEAWVNLAGLSQGALNPRLVANSHTDVDHNGFQLMVTNAGQPQFWVGTGAAAGNAAGGAVGTSGWAYVAGTWDGTTVKLYVNGVLVKSSAFAGSMTAGSATGIGLGYGAAYAGDYLNGLLAECAVYGSAASAATIAARYAAAVTTVSYSDASAYDDGSRDIVNTIVLQLPERTPSPRNPSIIWEDAAQPLTVPLTEDPTIVFKTTDNIQVPSGGTTTVLVSAADPFQDAQVPQAGTEWTQLTGTTTASLSRTSGQSTTITLTDGGGGSVIGGLILRGRPVTQGRVYQVSAADATSVTAYGTRGLPSGVDMSWCSAQDAAAISALILTQYKQRRPIVTFPVRNANSTRLTQMLLRDISDRVTVTDTQTGMNADAFIENIKYTMSGGGRFMETVFGCEKAPAAVTTPWTFGTSLFGTGVFGL